MCEANSLSAEYLFQSDKYYDSAYDSGDKSIQCGRKVDSLKLWLALIARGQDRMEQLVDNVYEMAHYAIKLISSRPNFKLVLPKFQGSNICFWYIPPSMNISINGKLNSVQDMERLNKVCPAIKGKMMKESKIMVNYQPLSSKGLPNFFRLVLTCIPPSTTDDIDFFVDQIEQLGSSILIQ